MSDWKVEHGVAQAQDVAMATKANRIALHGGLDFVNERFDEVSVALVDAKGCVTVQQRIRGSFQEPVVDKPNAVAALAGPALRLLKKGGRPRLRQPVRGVLRRLGAVSPGERAASPLSRVVGSGVAGSRISSGGGAGGAFSSARQRSR